MPAFAEPLLWRKGYDEAELFPQERLLTCHFSCCSRRIPYVCFPGKNRITAAGFYATERSVLSYATAMAELCFMLAFMLILPRFFGGQIMVWWSTVLAQISAAALAVIFALKTHRDENVSGEHGS